MTFYNGQIPTASDLNTAFNEKTTKPTSLTTSASSLTGSEIVTIVQNGVETVATVSQIAAGSAGKANAAAVGIGASDNNLGTFSGSIIPSNSTVKQALQSVSDAVGVQAKAVAIGIGSGDTNMGSFSGVTIPDNVSAKVGMQALETAVETRLPYVSGLVGNYDAGDSAKIAAAITAAWAAEDAGFQSAKIRLPKGDFQINGFTLTRPIEIEGEGQNATRLKVVGNVPAFTVAVAHDGYNYYGDFGAPIVSIKNLCITGSKAAGSSQHGVYMDIAGTNPIYYGVTLTGVRMSNLGGDGVTSSSGLGANAFLRTFDTYIYQINGWGMNLRYNWDTRHFGGEIGVCGAGGVNIAGGGGCEFYGVNCYANSGPGLAIYLTAGLGNTAFKWVGGSIDSNQGGNITYDIRVAGEWAEFTNVNFGGAGSASPGTVPDVLVASTAVGKLTFVGCKWRKAYADDPSNSSLRPISFGAGATTVAEVVGSTGWADPNASTFTNLPQNVSLVMGSNTSRFVSPVQVRQGVQYDGIKLQSQDGTAVGQIIGYAANAKGGVIILSNSDGSDSVVLPSVSSGLAPKINFANGKYADNTTAVAALGANCIYWNTTTSAFALTT